MLLAGCFTQQMGEDWQMLDESAVGLTGPRCQHPKLLCGVALQRWSSQLLSLANTSPAYLQSVSASCPLGVYTSGKAVCYQLRQPMDSNHLGPDDAVCALGSFLWHFQPKHLQVQQRLHQLPHTRNISWLLMVVQE